MGAPGSSSEEWLRSEAIQVFTGLAQAGGSPAHSQQLRPARSALTPAQGAPEHSGCQLATAAPGPWESFLPGEPRDQVAVQKAVSEGALICTSGSQQGATGNV